MQRRSALRGLSALLLLGAAACQDESPTLSGEEFFPGGGRPTTLEVVLPASEFLETLGVFSGFSDEKDFLVQIVANDYGEPQGLDAHALYTLGFPKQPSYSQSGTTRFDSLYTLTGGRLVVDLDSAGSRPVGPVTLRLFTLAQDYDPSTTSWTYAVDSAGERTPWTVPGGTPGPQVGQVVYTPGSQAGDTVSFALDSVTLNRIRRDSVGLLLTSATTGTRVQVGGIRLTTGFHPSNAARDTVIPLDVGAGSATFVFTPEPPQVPGTIQAGGVYAARTVFRLDLDRPLPGCAPPQTCAAVRLEDVQVNRVSLLLDPIAPPNGFDPITTIPLTLFTVPEPDLGAGAPLGGNILDLNENGLGLVIQSPGDTVVELPITSFALASARADTLPDTFALLGERAQGDLVLRTFGIGLYDAEPRLRIIYTLPTRPELP
ncbi:MAG TPA: hypothetical protein VHG91_00950 [Longimicrobium sp.]|nr:hypothetical protein [Longimicrobium sp.]